MDSNKHNPLLLFGISFACLGLLIGNMVGLSADSLVRVLIPALFAFGGGSVLVILRKLSVDEQRMAAVAISTLSIFCLLGVYVGILQAEHRFFTPQSDQSFGDTASSMQSNKYLHDSEIETIYAIDAKYSNKFITAEEAYDQLFKVVERVE